MTAEIFLRRAQLLKRRIHLKLREYSHIQDLATRITCTLYPEPGRSGVSDRVGDAAVRMADLTREVEALQAELAQASQSILQMLDRLPEKECAVLHGFFLNELSAEEIGDCMLPHPLTARHVYRIRARALAHVQEFLDADTAEKSIPESLAGKDE